MNAVATTLQHVGQWTAHEAATVGKSVSQALHSTGAHLIGLPVDQRAVAALAAAASIFVTLVTLYFWPRDVEPPRETSGASEVRQLAERGLPASDIARRTGLSHDAVATIIRARELAGGARTASTRKSRPSAA